MGLAEDLKALQELREKHELSEFQYAKARDALMKKQAAPSAELSVVYFIGKRLLPLVLLVVVVIVAWRVIDSVYRQTPETNRQSRPLNLLAQPHSIPVTNGALTVNANSLSWYTFTVPPNATTVAVNGHFHSIRWVRKRHHCLYCR